LQRWVPHFSQPGTAGKTKYAASKRMVRVSKNTKKIRGVSKRHPQQRKGNRGRKGGGKSLVGKTCPWEYTAYGHKEYQHRCGRGPSKMSIKSKQWFRDMCDRGGKKKTWERL